VKAAEIQVMNLDHLGLVAGIIDQIGIAHATNAFSFTSPMLSPL
jgi:hypothetical protein